MALTATAVKQTRDIIFKTLGMKNPIIIAASPNRDNICYSVKFLSKNTPLVSHFLWLLNALKQNEKHTDRVIIYCQTIRQCHKLYSIIFDNLDGELSDHNQLIEMLHSNTPERVKNRIIESMSNVDGLVRVLVCTISFGMGVDCVGVKTGIHLGPSKNVESYVQESGRCGRDGCQSNSIIYYVGRMLTHDGTKCRKKWLLSHFDIENSKNQKTSLHAVKHTCCDLCAKNCSCSACDCPVNAIPSTSAGTQNQCTRTRQISSEQLQELTKQLIILRKELNLSIFEKFVGHTGQIHTPDMPIFFNQFGSFQINQVLQHAKHLFSIGDIICNVEIWKHDHAVKVYKVFYDVFKDVEPLSDNILTLQEESYDNDSDELEWDDFMDDDNIPNISASIMDMSSFDFDMGNIDVEDDIIPPAIEDALQHVCYT